MLSGMARAPAPMGFVARISSGPDVFRQRPVSSTAIRGRQERAGRRRPECRQCPGTCYIVDPLARELLAVAAPGCRWSFAR